jgi:hypothetical protein
VAAVDAQKLAEGTLRLYFSAFWGAAWMVSFIIVGGRVGLVAIFGPVAIAYGLVGLLAYRNRYSQEAKKSWLIPLTAVLWAFHLVTGLLTFGALLFPCLPALLLINALTPGKK